MLQYFTREPGTLHNATIMCSQYVTFYLHVVHICVADWWRDDSQSKNDNVGQPARCNRPGIVDGHLLGRDCDCAALLLCFLGPSVRPRPTNSVSDECAQIVFVLRRAR